MQTLIATQSAAMFHKPQVRAAAVVGARSAFDSESDANGRPLEGFFETSPHQHRRQVATVARRCVDVAWWVDVAVASGVRSLGDRLSAWSAPEESFLRGTSHHRRVADAQQDDLGVVAQPLETQGDRDGNTHEREVSVASSELLKGKATALSGCRERHLHE